MRKGAVSRKTNETAIEVAVDLDGSGKADVVTGVDEDLADQRESEPRQAREVIHVVASWPRFNKSNTHSCPTTQHRPVVSHRPARRG